jgi:hypothetical protein
LDGAILYVGDGLILEEDIKTGQLENPFYGSNLTGITLVLTTPQTEDTETDTDTDTAITVEVEEAEELEMEEDYYDDVEENDYNVEERRRGEWVAITPVGCAWLLGLFGCICLLVSMAHIIATNYLSSGRK